MDALPSQSPRPDVFWRAIFLDQKVDYSVPFDKRPVPVDILPRPTWFKNRPVGIESKVYLGSIKVTKENETENERRWHDLVLKNGNGTYNFYDTIDEAGEHPVSLFGWWKIIFMCGEDVEALRLGIGQEPLTDARLEELELAVDSEVARGDARSAELVALEYERRGRLVEAHLVASYGMKASDHDKGIWDDYLEEKVPERNTQRRLLAIYNRVKMKSTPPGLDGSLYSTVDVGEADPKVACEKCGKLSALPTECVLGAVRLCYSCRRLPRSEWPARKPIPSLFSFSSSKNEEARS